MERAFVKPEVLAKVIDVSKSTIYTWHHEDRLPISAVKINGALRFRCSDVEALIAGKIPKALA